MSNKNIYATPRIVTDIGECYFYHTMDIPGYGHVEGEWDLREGVVEYLGGVDFRGKRVLDVGTASGFICFYVESQGAEVIAFDLSEKESWDVVPFAQYDYEQYALARKAHIKKLNNSFWLCHKAYNSKAKVVYGTVYALPAEIGLVDISICGVILRHLRDPFLALQNVLRLTKETVIIIEGPLKLSPPSEEHTLYMQFLPRYNECEPKETWWHLPPKLIQEFIGILGFEKSKVTYHTQIYLGQKRTLYTVVGHRTR